MLKIFKDESGGLDASLYSIDRSGQALPTTEFLYRGDDVEFAMGSINARFQGKINRKGDAISGRWAQGGEATELTFQRPAASALWEIPAPPERLRPASSHSAGTYEVATVKPAEPYTQGGGMRVAGRSLEAINTTVSDLIQFGYELHANQILGGPAWLNKEKYDVTMLFEGQQYPNDPQCKAMVREVLKERFGLQFHHATQQLRAYALVQVKGGPKLTKSEGDPNGLPGLYLRGPGIFGAHNATMADFTGALQRMVLDSPVLDKTGISGRWDFGLEWTPDDLQLAGHPGNIPTNSGKPDLFTAIKDQLGLKLESTNTAAEALVIESMNRPTEN